MPEIIDFTKTKKGLAGPPSKRILGILKKGDKILELGNKKFRGKLFRHWYVYHGLQYWCTDINGLDGAIPWDIRKEIPQKLKDIAPFDVITNFGFTEHVQTNEGQAACWAHIHQLLKVGGHISSTLPQPGYWKNHGIPSGYPGIYYPYPEFFEEFAKLNNYKIDDLWINKNKHITCCRLIKLGVNRFVMPDKGMYKNI